MTHNLLFLFYAHLHLLHFSPTCCHPTYMAFYFVFALWNTGFNSEQSASAWAWSYPLVHEKLLKTRSLVQHSSATDRSPERSKTFRALPPSEIEHYKFQSCEDPVPVATATMSSWVPQPCHALKTVSFFLSSIIQHLYSFCLFFWYVLWGLEWVTHVFHLRLSICLVLRRQVSSLICLIFLKQSFAMQPRFSWNLQFCLSLQGCTTSPSSEWILKASKECMFSIRI